MALTCPQMSHRVTCYMPRPTERLTSAGCMLGTVTEPTVANTSGQKYFSSLTCTYLAVHSPLMNKICLFLQYDILLFYGKLQQAIKLKIVDH